MGVALLATCSAISRHAPGKCSLKNAILFVRAELSFVRDRMRYRMSASKRARLASFSVGLSQRNGSANSI
jgi:hypothetical protein